MREQRREKNIETKTERKRDWKKISFTFSSVTKVTESNEKNEN